MNKEDAEEYTQSLGQIVGGSWRQIALAQRMGVPKALGMKLEDWVKERLGGYIRMSVSERKEAAAQLKAEGFSDRQIAGVTGVSHTQIQRDAGTKVPDISEKDNPNNECSDDIGTNVPPLDAIPQASKTRTANEQKRKEELHRPANVSLLCGLRHGDFRELADAIPDASVQLVFTDPPYDKESVKLYDDAARIARRILRPGGSFIAYSGQRHLGDVLTSCSRHLEYWWTICNVHSGGNQILNKLGVRCTWKPLVWFVKGTRGDVQNIVLDTVTGDREKDVHEWQQAECEARYYIDKLTTPDGVVVDFFVGGGTTLVAAKALGRKWIGFEIDATTAERASQRIEGEAV